MVYRPYLILSSISLLTRSSRYFLPAHWPFFLFPEHSRQALTYGFCTRPCSCLDHFLYKQYCISPTTHFGSLPSLQLIQEVSPIHCFIALHSIYQHLIYYFTLLCLFCLLSIFIHQYISIGEKYFICFFLPRNAPNYYYVAGTQQAFREQMLNQ